MHTDELNRQRKALESSALHAKTSDEADSILKYVKALENQAQTDALRTLATCAVTALRLMTTPPHKRDHINIADDGSIQNGG